MESSSKNILIVDDRPNWRNILSTIFVGSGNNYVIQTAKSLEEANNLIDQNHFGLVITNLGLEPSYGNYDRSGLKVVDNLQKRAPGTPCIVFTAFDDSIREQVESYCTKYNAPIWVMWKWGNNVYKDLTDKVYTVFNDRPSTVSA